MSFWRRDPQVSKSKEKEKKRFCGLIKFPDEGDDEETAGTGNAKLCRQMELLLSGRCIRCDGLNDAIWINFISVFVVH